MVELVPDIDDESEEYDDDNVLMELADNATAHD